jgi:acetyl-CoA C-acetyltransferase
VAASTSDNDVVIIDAVRTPFGRRGKGLSTMHAVDLLGVVQKALFDRTGADPAAVGQVIGGCVGQIGMQAMNVTRTAWLTAGLPLEVAATTVDAQCGSSQQAVDIAYALIAGGVVDSAVACGIEIMSRIGIGATIPKEPDLGRTINRNYWAHYEFTNQFEAAERLADKYGLTRSDADNFGNESQNRGNRAWDEGRFATQVVPVDVPDLGPDGKPSGTTHRVDKDEGIRETTLDALAGLKPTGRADGIHTAGSTSQIADGASAVLLMTRKKAADLGLNPMATIVETCLVGCDPVMLLEGPIPATRKLLESARLAIDEVDLVEINEAFASVVLAWERETKADLAKTNPNGGAIALGHPLGATGSALITKAVHELVRADGEHALVTMCCGGGLGTGTLLRRG